MAAPEWQFDGIPNNEEHEDQPEAEQHPQQPQQPQQLEVKFANVSGSVLSFKLKNTTQLKKAMDAYSAKHELDRKTLRFLFDGDRVQDWHTTADLGIENGDTVEVHTEQIGGGTM